MVVDGVELLRMIRDNEFKDGDEIEEDRRIFKYNADVESFFEVDGDGNPMTDCYTDKEFASAKFEIISEEIYIQEIEELQELKLTNNNIAVDIAVINRDKINKLIKAIKQLDKKIK